jgi:peptide subunit release factor 1 (eRF1)
LTQTAKQYHLSRTKMLEYLVGLATQTSDEQVTVFIPPKLAPDKLKTVLQSVPASAAMMGEMYDISTASPNGAAIFWGSGEKKLIIPPFPIRDSVIMEGFETAHLKTMIGIDYIIGVVLIRLGAYGIGVCKGEKLITSKIGTGLVHSRHRQGGSSSHRFERHRDKQMETFFIRVCEHTMEQLEPYVKSMDYLVYGGAWETVQLFIKYCPFLGKLEKPVLPTLSDTLEPKRAVLEKAAGRIYASVVWEWA